MKQFISLMQTPFVLLSTDYNSATSGNSSSRFISYFQINFKRMQRFFKNSPKALLILVVIIVLALTFFLIKGFVDGTSHNNPLTDDRVEISKPLAKQDINKTFDFPLKDAKGKEVSKLSWTIQTVELRNEIIVKGQRARSVKGRVFLVVNIKITNNYTQAVAVNSRDYLRFIINNSSEKLAADIHNDPVDVQAISTKYTRLALPINETDKNITLQIGEILGEKEMIKLNLK